MKKFGICNKSLNKETGVTKLADHEIRLKKLWNWKKLNHNHKR